MFTPDPTQVRLPHVHTQPNPTHQVGFAVNPIPMCVWRGRKWISISKPLAPHRLCDEEGRICAQRCSLLHRDAPWCRVLQGCWDDSECDNPNEQVPDGPCQIDGPWG